MFKLMRLCSFCAGTETKIGELSAHPQILAMRFCLAHLRKMALLQLSVDVLY